jgi:hypothetical protein
VKHENPQLVKVVIMQAAANRALCDLSKASPAAAKTILGAGAIKSIKQQLDGTDDTVKEAGLDAVAVIAAQSAAMAEAAMDNELLDKVVAIVASPSTPISLLESACTALDNVAAQTPALAQQLLKAQVVPPLLAVLRNNRMCVPRLQTGALRCICQIAHHESLAAAAVADAGAVPVAMQFAADDSNAAVRHAAAALLQQVAVRTARLSKEVASEGCIVALMESLQLDRGTAFAAAPVMALAHIAAFGSAFAQAVRSLC